MQDTTKVTDFSGIRNEDLYPDKSTVKPPKQTLSPNKKEQEKKSALSKELIESVAAVSNAARNVTDNQFQGIRPRAFGYNERQQGVANREIVGKSKYDSGYFSDFSYDNILNNRAEQQPEILKAINGLGKGVVNFGTTFLTGVTILPAGIIQGLVNLGDDNDATNFWSGFSQNGIAKAAQSINDKFEEWLPNYRAVGEDQIFGSWGNFLGDTILKNFGFIAGTLVSGGTGIPGLITKGAGKLATRMAGKLGAEKVGQRVASYMTRTAVGSLQASMTEGAIEAVNNSNQWERSAVEILNEELRTGKINNQQYKERKEQIQKDKVKFANMDFGLNIPILMASNMIEFGRFLAGGFDTAVKFGTILKKEGLYSLSKNPAKFAVVTGKNVLSEALEEQWQGIASIQSGLSATEDYMSFVRDGKNYKAQKNLNLLLNNLGEGIRQGLHDKSLWEEFAVGGIFGALGMGWAVKNPATGKREFQWNGGIYGSIRDYIKDNKDIAEKINTINTWIQEDLTGERYKTLVKRISLSDKMAAAALDKNKFDFKNAELADLVAAVEMYQSIGKLDDFLQMIDNITTDDISMATANEMISDTVETAEGPTIKSMLQDEKGNQLNMEEFRNRVEKAKESAKAMAKRYSKVISDIDAYTDGQLKSEAKRHLAWMQLQTENWQQRANELYQNPNIKAVVSRMYDLLPLNEKQRESVVKAMSENNGIALGTLIAQNPGFYLPLKEALETNEDKQAFDDYIACCKGNSNFHMKYQEYLNNPVLLEEDMMETENQIREQWYNDRLDETMQNLESVDNVEDFRNVFEGELPSLKNRLKDRILNGENDVLKDFMTRYDTLIDARNQLETLFDEYAHNIKEESTVIALLDEKNGIGVFKAIEDAVLNGETLVSALDKAAKAAPMKSELRKALYGLKKKANLLQKSRNASVNPDANTPSEPAPKTAQPQVQQPAPTNAEEAFRQRTQQEENAKLEEIFGPDWIDSLNKPQPQPQNQQLPELTEEEDNEDGNLVGKTEEDVTETIDEITPEPEPAIEDTSDDKSDNLKFTNWRGKETVEYQIDSLQKQHKAWPLTNSFVKFMRRMRAYDFISKGDFARIVAQHKQNGKPLVIHILQNTNPKFEDGVLMTNGYPKCLLAIDITNEHLAYPEYSNPVEINGKKYQIVGELGGKDVTKENGVVFQKSKLASQSIFRKQEHEGKGWGVSNISLTLKDVYGGRFIRSVEGDANNRIPVKYRNLREVLKKGKPITAKDVKLGVLTMKGLVTTAVNAVPVNGYNDDVAGSVWLMTLQADGRSYPRHCVVRRLNEWSRDSDFKNTPYYKKIHKYLTTLCDSSLEESARAEARANLEKYIFFGPWDKEANMLVNRIHWNVNSQTGVQELWSKAFKHNIPTAVSNQGGTQTARNVDEIVADVENQLFDSNLRLQVAATLMADNNYIKEIYESDVLQTDLVQVENVNVSFDMWENKEGKIENKGGHLGKGIDPNDKTVFINGMEIHSSLAEKYDRGGNRLSDELVDFCINNKKFDFSDKSGKYVIFTDGAGLNTYLRMTTANGYQIIDSVDYMKAKEQYDEKQKKANAQNIQNQTEGMTWEDIENLGKKQSEQPVKPDETLTPDEYDNIDAEPATVETQLETTIIENPIVNEEETVKPVEQQQTQEPAEFDDRKFDELNQMGKDLSANKLKKEVAEMSKSDMFIKFYMDSKNGREAYNKLSKLSDEERKQIAGKLANLDVNVRNDVKEIKKIADDIVNCK